MKRLLVLFPSTENIHLTKDVGMIPFVLNKYYQYDATLACYDNGPYTYLSSEVKGLKVSFIKKLTGSPTFDALCYIFSKGRKIDILQLYHLTSFSLILAFFFKCLTLGKGIVYLKLDAGDDVNELVFRGFRKYIFILAKKSFDLITAENTKIVADINKSRLFAKPVNIIPNGYYPNIIQADGLEKENIILTVGRIGTYQKNNELLIEAFQKFVAKNQQWKLVMVGPVTESFQSFLHRFIVQHPNLLNKVELTGSIADRSVLKDYYLKAKIFALSSRFEGFPLVFLEAMNAGCTIVSTEFYAAYDVTGFGKFGKLCKFDDANGYAEALSELALNQPYLADNSHAIKEYASTSFYWPIICDGIDRMIKNIK